MIARYDARRFWALTTVFAAVFLLVTLRLAWLQVVRRDYWVDRAAHRSTRVVSRPAPRGRILDRNGSVLAVTEIHTDVGFAPSAPQASEVDAQLVASLLDVPARQLERRMRGARKYTVLARDRILSPHARDVLRRIPAITLEDRARRRHPHGQLALRLLGTVSRAGDGTNGLERTLDELLAGARGEELQRLDRHDRIRSRVPLHPPVEGMDVRLTLDATVQGILESELEKARVESGAHRAQGIVMDPTTGEVLGLAQVPLSPAPIEALDRADPNRVMAATDLFEPGSSFKLLTTASLLSRSVTDTATTYDGMRPDSDAHRALKVFEDGQKIHDAHPVGEVSLRRAFVVSSNIIYATAVEDLRKREFSEDLHRFGIGRTLGTGLPHEVDGLIRAVGDWSSYDKRTIAYGQGVSVTLLQMGAIYSALVTDGYLRTPQLVRAWSDTGGELVDRPGRPQGERRIVPPRIIPVLRDLCRAVVQEEGGTGWRARVEGLDVGGKTGTAQVPARTGGYEPGVYTPNFFGFVPAANPRLLVGIVMHRVEDRHASGGKVAAPVFQQVVRKIAAATRYLDATVVAQPMENDLESLPDLRGQSARRVNELAAQSGWVLQDPSADEGARAVGQIPQPGTRVRPGALIRVVWAGGQP